jgi:hypothetical protein
LSDRRPQRGGSRSGSRTVTRPNRRGGSPTCNARRLRGAPRGLGSRARRVRGRMPGTEQRPRWCRAGECRRSARQPCGWRLRRRRGAG